MNKKIIISIISFIVVICLFFSIRIISGNKIEDKEKIIEDEENINAINISDTVSDECINEWEDYSLATKKEIEQVDIQNTDDDTHYLLKDVDGYIFVYYLDESNGEKLYKETEISTEYLSDEDLDDLEIGIEVIGGENLNRMLEDFE